MSKATATTSATGCKEKDSKPSRKFGLSLFRRNGGKKEKPKKEYASFSGQFPPEEWPVRDEDDLNNLPRDLEHAIIKRINPELTVDNLTRHTVLMKKLEERRERGMDRVLDRGLDKTDKGVDKGMSTEIAAFSKPRHHHHSSKAGAGKRPAPKTSRSKRRAHSSREKQKERERVKSKAPICASEYPKEEDLIPTRLKVEIPVDEPDPVEEGGTVDGRGLYKKRIENLFQTCPGKEADPVIPDANNREHKRREVKEGRTSEPGRKERTGHRSKSWDPHRAKATAPDAEHAGKSPTSDSRYDCVHDSAFHTDHRLQPDPKLNTELPVDFSSAYPQSSTLRIDDKIRHQTDRNSKECWEGRKGPLRASEYNSVPLHSYTPDDGPPNAQQYSSTVTVSTYPHKPVTNQSHEATPAWPRPSLQRKHSLRLKTHQDNVQRPDESFSPTQSCETAATHEEQDIKLIANNNIEQRALSHGERPELKADGTPSATGADGFLEDDYRLYQRDHEQEEDACSSLCLNEEETIDAADAYQSGVRDHHQQLVFHSRESDLQCQSHHSHYLHHYRVALTQDLSNSLKDLGPPAIHKEVCVSPARPVEANLRLQDQRTRSPGAHGESSSRQGTMIHREKRQDTNLHLECPKPSQVADSSIFDYCQTGEIESDTETVRKSADEGDGESAHWAAEVEEMQQDGFDEMGGAQMHAAFLGRLSGARGAEIREVVEMGENQSITGDSGIDSPR